jgi:hypothetical protein
MKLKHYEIVFASTGWLIRPLEALDNRRWYFNSRADAVSHANYLERHDL